MNIEQVAVLAYMRSSEEHDVALSDVQIHYTCKFEVGRGEGQGARGDVESTPPRYWISAFCEGEAVHACFGPDRCKKFIRRVSRRNENGHAQSRSNQLRKYKLAGIQCY